MEREVGGGIGMGNTCKPMAVLFQSMTKFTTNKLINKLKKKFQMELPYDPGIPLLGIHIKETRVERDTCTPMFITVLFILARTWKQPRCPWAEE